ncbi:MAG: hypothetical protein KME60_02210 [Cyanomargarita calcarea GSE-NOS-MK-12-04C]|jgi:hypothetical protein|uniref:Uncharacterized protein n=1 Tax=Cyanomargarita calcarea GSE-NOS-MK-12-04C TaxID=2839659 RepID=A0A951USW8_9CYAN|nr:hypothetical protein [Cyanomargarita calcarea GSE-NOS-MK-12-04C]
MGLRLQVEIKESLEELEKAVKYATTASSKERLQMLYWLKSGQVTSLLIPQIYLNRITHILFLCCHRELQRHLSKVHLNPMRLHLEIWKFMIFAVQAKEFIRHALIMLLIGVQQSSKAIAVEVTER